MLNQTSVTEFLLLGITDIQALQPYLFVLFLAIYAVSVIENGAVLTVVISDPRLHLPMYVFLGNLSCLDICYSTVTLPKMLENFFSTHKAISFLGCISQLHFFQFLGTAESLLLAAMAFDRFVLCTQMAVTVWTIGFFHALLHSITTSRLNFCRSNQIQHFFCDVKPLLELACGNTELHQWLLNTVTGTIATGPFFLTLLSYFYIIISLFSKSHSCSTLHKALSTCASHFTVVILFYVPVLYTYTRPPSRSAVQQDLVTAIMYSAVTPVLNPLIYTLRNKDVKGALTDKIDWLCIL
uniref:Olfactory receptor 12D2-like n=1 Tax=Ailuropoda melanoleuca TaxID=9646 RepID=G1LM01_AILME